MANGFSSLIFLMSQIIRIALFVLLANFILGDQLDKIEVHGNKRMESETVKSYLHINQGDQFSEKDVEKIYKKLFSTGFFKEIKVEKKGSRIVINLKENPIINKIAYEGNDALKDDQIAKDMPLKPRKILSVNDVQNAQQRLLEIYRRMGYFGAKVEPKIIERDHNRVDLVFEIEEGKVSTIEKIVFIGNEKVSSIDLEDAILSKRSKWWRFFATDDRYDPDRLMADQQALRQLYNNKGYPDFRIVNALAEFNRDKKSFYLSFVLEEGDLYHFGSASVKTKISGIDTKRLEKEITFSSGDRYSAAELDKTSQAISEILGEKGYAFVVVEPLIEKDKSNKTVSIVFSVKEGPRIYVDQILIKGNYRTYDEVIRRELTLHEGDIFNTTKLKQSEGNLKDLDYFKEASIEPEQGNAKDRANLIVKVEEQSTGSVRLSAGYATLDGPVLNVGFSERNFMGKGYTIHTDASIGKKIQDFNIGLINPYLFGRKLVGSFDVYSTKSSRYDSYTTKALGFGVGIGYNLTTNLMQKWNYSLCSNKVSKIDDDSSIFLINEPRKSVSSSIAHTLRYDRRDSIVEPTKGYMLSMTNTICGVGGNVGYLRNDFSATVFYTPVEQILTLLRTEFGHVQKLGKKRFRIADSIYLGADSFKGFEFGGIGPRDIASKNKDGLGGRKYWKATFENQFSMGLPVDLGIKGAAFVEAGSVWDAAVKSDVERKFTVKETDNAGNVIKDPVTGQDKTKEITRKTHLIDNRKTRISAGIGIIWKGPFGPLRIDYAIPIVRSKIDETQRINISYHTPL